MSDKDLLTCPVLKAKKRPRYLQHNLLGDKNVMTDLETGRQVDTRPVKGRTRKENPRNTRGTPKEFM